MHLVSIYFLSFTFYVLAYNIFETSSGFCSVFSCTWKSKALMLWPSQASNRARLTWLVLQLWFATCVLDRKWNKKGSETSIPNHKYAQEEQQRQAQLKKGDFTNTPGIKSYTQDIYTVREKQNFCMYHLYFRRSGDDKSSSPQINLRSAIKRTHINSKNGTRCCIH